MDSKTEYPLKNQDHSMKCWVDDHWTSQLPIFWVYLEVRINMTNKIFDNIWNSHLNLQISLNETLVFNHNATNKRAFAYYLTQEEGDCSIIFYTLSYTFWYSDPILL